MNSFPIVDLTGLDDADQNTLSAMAAIVDQICRDTGFFLLTGHGVPAKVIQDVWQTTEAFFAQDVAEKQKVAPPQKGQPYGYLQLNSEALARSKGDITPPDLKESFNAGPQFAPPGVDQQAASFCYAPTPWPAIPGFQDAWSLYYNEMAKLAEELMTLFARALRLPADFFCPFIENPISALRALHYPATVNLPLEKQQRAGAHTDYGSLTILLPQPGSQGLQVMQNGVWVDVPAPEGAFVINIGDLMARWTADRWVSTLHRVVARPDQPARQSLAYFHQPDWNAEIVPLDGSDTYPAVRSGPYLMDKFKATGV